MSFTISMELPDLVAAFVGLDAAVAALIVLLMALGFATFILGLFVIFPWLAHASWHACRDMVDGSP